MILYALAAFLMDNLKGYVLVPRVSVTECAHLKALRKRLVNDLSSYLLVKTLLIWNDLSTPYNSYLFSFHPQSRLNDLSLHDLEMKFF